MKKVLSLGLCVLALGLSSQALANKTKFKTNNTKTKTEQNARTTNTQQRPNVNQKGAEVAPQNASNTVQSREEALAAEAQEALGDNCDLNKFAGVTSEMATGGYIDAGSACSAKLSDDAADVVGDMTVAAYSEVKHRNKPFRNLAKKFKVNATKAWIAAYAKVRNFSLKKAYAQVTKICKAENCGRNLGPYCNFLAPAQASAIR